jgi:hypothetical protein
MNSQPYSLARQLLLIFVSAALLLPRLTRAEEEEKPENAIVELILTEETPPNEPKELSLRITTDYRKNDGEVIAVLPRVEVFYGLVKRVDVELSVPMAIIKERTARPTE